MLHQTPYLAGAAFGFSLIAAIGAQNAHVLRQGLARSHVFLVAALCVAVDWALIVAGAVGFGAIIARFPALTSVAAWGGAGFLAVYGALAFKAAARPGHLDTRAPGAARQAATLGTVVVTTLAVSLLNPHVYLDTIVLLGSIAAQYPAAQRVWFVAGACTASLVWFFALGYGARLLAPIFERPSAWRVLDIVIGVIMWWIAAGLVWGQLH